MHFLRFALKSDVKTVGISARTRTGFQSLDHSFPLGIPVVDSIQEWRFLQLGTYFAICW